jgi:small subunit ribosomal protein S6
MPVNSYECLFLLDATKMASEAETIKTNLHSILEKYGAEVLVGRKWDENRKLAYPIDKQKKGYYYLTFFKSDSKKITEMERDFRINENILRHLVTVVDPKWETDMLAVARDEHAMALQLMHEEAPEGGPATGPDGLPIEGMEDGDRPRRGPRRGAEPVMDKE